MTRSLFSDKQIKVLKPRKSVYRVFENSRDPDSKGFGVVVTPNGTVSFFLAFTSPIDGARKQLALGRHHHAACRAPQGTKLPC